MSYKNRVEACHIRTELKHVYNTNKICDFDMKKTRSWLVLILVAYLFHNAKKISNENMLSSVHKRKWRFINIYL